MRGAHALRAFLDLLISNQRGDGATLPRRVNKDRRRNCLDRLVHTLDIKLVNAKDFPEGDGPECR